MRNPCREKENGKVVEAVFFSEMDNNLSTVPIPEKRFFMTGFRKVHGFKPSFPYRSGIT
jgi:hypothetical protein